MEVLLALIVSASVSALKPGELLQATAEGVWGNQTDAVFLMTCRHLVKTLGAKDSQRASEPIQASLRRSLWLSYLRALVSISSTCKAKLVGDFPRTYRGQPIYASPVKSDIRWLDGNLERLNQEIKAVDSKDAQIPELSLEDLKGFLLSVEQSPKQPPEQPPEQSSEQPESATQMATQRLMTFASTEDAIPLYVQRLQQPGQSLLDETFRFFVQQLDQQSELRTFFETQLLVQIHGSLAEQKYTLADIDRNLKQVSQDVSQVPQQFERVIGKLEAIATDERPDVILGMVRDVRSLLLGTQQGSVEQTDMVSFAVSDANPFVPLGGRIDSADQFFGHEQTLRMIFETLNSGSSVALIGDREMGKSSLLKAVEARAKTELTIPREPIYLDLRNVADEADFYYALCHKVGIPECKGFRLSRELQAKRLLLILDEIEKMTWDGFTNQVRGQLRSLAEGGNAPLRLVIAASKSLDRLFVNGADGNRVSPLSGICREELVTPWSDAVIREFIRDRLQPTSVVFSETDILSIIQASEGKPREIVKLCHQRYASLQKQMP